MKRHTAHHWLFHGVCLGLGFWALSGCFVGVAAGAPYTVDPVQGLKQTLKVAPDPSNEEALKFRKTALEEQTRTLSVSDLRRALMLQEWRDEDPEPKLARIDQEVRDQLVKRLAGVLEKALASSNQATQLAGIDQVAELGINVRGAGPRAPLAKGFGPTLVKLMKGSDRRVAEAAARALGKISPSPELAGKALADMLKSSDVGLRRAAAQSLESLLQVLVSYTKSSVTTGVEIARPDIVATAKAVVPAASKGMGDADRQVQTSSLNAIRLAAAMFSDLVIIPTRQDFPPAGRKATAGEADLIKRYRKEVKDERVLLVPLAQELDHVVARLASLLNNANPAVRLQTARTLKEIGYARVRMERKAATVPPMPMEKADASNTNQELVHLAQLAGHTPVEEGVEAADSPGDKVWDDPLLGGLKSVMPQLVARLKDPDLAVRLAALETLETLGTNASSVVPQVTQQSLRDDNRFVRWAAARFLSKVGPPFTSKPVAGLASLMSDSDLDVRMASARTLADYGSIASAAVPALTAAASSGDAEVREAAIHALQGIGRDEAKLVGPAVPALADALQNPDARVRRAAAEALGQLGPVARSAAPALQKTVNDTNAEVRGAVADALLAVMAEK